MSTAPISNDKPTAPESSRKIGGVSRQPAAMPADGPASGQHAPDFKYNGGAVIRCPQVYGAFWGPQWSDAAHQARATHLAQFMKDLLASQYMNVLSQYGVGSGAGVAGSYVKSTFVPNCPAQLSDTGIHSLIQSCINAGTLPEPPATNSNICLVIWLDESVQVNATTLGIRMCEPTGDNAFGYHYDFVTAAGHEFYYALIPALSDTCINNTCPGGCSLTTAQPQEQRITQVTSHEFSEMTTDPKFRLGWYGTVSDENGDICNGQTASITVGANTWAVQRQYSKADDVATNGVTWSVVTAPSPMPKLAGGPASGTQIARAQLLQQVAPMLPLPSSTFDPATKADTINDNEVAAYTDRLFAPFDHANLAPGLPALLRRFADHLDKPKK
jgi:hypothetical protein